MSQTVNEIAIQTICDVATGTDKILGLDMTSQTSPRPVPTPPKPKPKTPTADVASQSRRNSAIKLSQVSGIFYEDTRYLTMVNFCTLPDEPLTAVPNVTAYNRSITLRDHAEESWREPEVKSPEPEPEKFISLPQSNKAVFFPGGAGKELIYSEEMIIDAYQDEKYEPDTPRSDNTLDASYINDSCDEEYNELAAYLGVQLISEDDENQVS